MVKKCREIPQVRFTSTQLSEVCRIQSRERMRPRLYPSHRGQFSDCINLTCGFPVLFFTIHVCMVLYDILSLNLEHHYKIIIRNKYIRLLLFLNISVLKIIIQGLSSQTTKQKTLALNLRSKTPVFTDSNYISMQNCFLEICALTRRKKPIQQNEFTISEDLVFCI